MAVIRYKCTVCDREIEIIEQPAGLERTGRCLITNKCRGLLYRIKRLEDFAVGKFPSDVIGLTNHIQRKVLYNHAQAIADQTWIIEHNLGVNPSVQIVVDREEEVDGVVVSSRLEVEPQLITIIDRDNLTILFDRPETGLAQIIARSSAVTQTVTTVDAGITYLPVSQSNILTIGVDCSSGQFPAGTVSGTQLVRLYFLDQETLDETAFESAAFKDYAARSPVSTSAWNDASEVFVNGQLYTVLTIDIGDPINDFGAPSAGAVLFQSGTDTSGFAYDQSPNMVVLLSDPPHANIDKNRWQLFRPEINVGPTLALDSFIFANGELFIDQTKVEDTFPPIFSVSNDQSCPVPIVASEGAFVLAFGYTFQAEGGGGTVYSSDSDINTWTGDFFDNGTSPAGAVYAESIDTWVVVSRKGSVTASILFSTDDGATWNIASTIPSWTGTGAKDKNIAWSPSLGLFIVGCNSGQIISSTDGDTWSNVSPGLFGGAQVTSVHWSSTIGLFLACTSANEVATSSTGTSGWTLVTNEPGGASSDDLGAIYSVGTRVFISNDTDETVYYSDDIDGAGAGTWIQSVVDVKPSSGAGTLAANSDGSVILWAGPGFNMGEYVWRSDDNGVNFTRIQVNSQVGLTDMYTWCVTYDTDYGFIVGGQESSASPNGHVIVTSDDGLTWTLRVHEHFSNGSPLIPSTRAFQTIASKNSTANGTP